MHNNLYTKKKPITFNCSASSIHLLWFRKGKQCQLTLFHCACKTWEEADMVVEEKQNKAVVDKSIWAWFKAILYVVLGIAMLSVLAEPLIESVKNLSKDAGISASLVSFILVPLATNAREAISAIKEASHKKPRIISLTISEVSHYPF